MLGTPKVKVVRRGYDASTASPVDMSFTSDYKLQKLVKAVNKNSTGYIAHGLGYAPQYMLMGKVPRTLTSSGYREYYRTGTHEWICPEGVTSVDVIAWGGGGAGGGLTTNNTRCGGGGGAGGQVAKKTVSVTAGTKYTIVVGAGGTGSSGNGTAGGDSSFGGTLVVAKGGAGGTAYQNGGGAGSGTTTGGVGDTVYRGGSGITGTTTRGGSGGGGAGASGAGFNGTTTVSTDLTSSFLIPGNGGLDNGGNTLGTDGLTAGHGGYGRTDTISSSDGLSAYYFGGGGGGGYNHNNTQTTDRIGGDGGDGRVYITVSRTIQNEYAMGNVRSVDSGADASNISINIGESDGMYAYVFLDPADQSTVHKFPLTKNYPKVVVGGVDGDFDNKRAIHSYYDSFKVFKTGTLSTSLPSVSYDGGEAGTYNIVNENGNDYIVEETVLSYEHNLGYIPMFSPFVDYYAYPTIVDDWNSQWNSRNDWIIGFPYGLGEVVTHPVSGKYYICIRTHTSQANSKPEEGTQWDYYWELHDYNDSFYGSTYNVNLNEYEDEKIIFGGVFVLDWIETHLYATETELVFKIFRACTNVNQDYGSTGNNKTFPLTNISVDYTIFYNRADEEFNLLS